MLFLSTTGIGAHCAFKLKEKCLICKELKQLCDILSIDISFRKNSVIRIIEENSFSHLDFIKPESVMNEKLLDTPLSDEENKELSAFLYSLGKSDTKSQLMLIEGFREYIEICEKSYDERYSKNAKLYRVLGVFSGALMSLMLI